MRSESARNEDPSSRLTISLKTKPESNNELLPPLPGTKAAVSQSTTADTAGDSRERTHSPGYQGSRFRYDKPTYDYVASAVTGRWILRDGSPLEKWEQPPAKRNPSARRAEHPVLSQYEIARQQNGACSRPARWDKPFQALSIHFRSAE